MEAREKQLRMETHGDIVKLYRYIRKLLGRELGFSSQVQDGKIYFESDPIKSDDPLLNLMTKEIVVRNCSGGITSTDEGELMYYFIIDVKYKHHGGGRNGTEIARAYRKENGEWIFQAVNE
jgi:hypothetical protein